MEHTPKKAIAGRRALSRRAFLAGTASLMAAPAVAIGAAVRPRITDGVASGDVTADSAVIWSRCDRPGRMMVEYATTESFRDAKRAHGADALPGTDFTAQTTLSGLPPGQTVFYRVRFEDLGDLKTPSAPVTGRFRTAPQTDGNPSFVWGGDMCGAGWGINPGWGGLRMFETLSRADPDLLIHCGDRIYADGALEKTVELTDGTVWRNLVTPAKSRVAETLDDYRGNYRYNLMDAHYRRFNAQAAQLVTWDDHEVTNDWWPGGIAAENGGYADARFDVLAARGRRAFFEYTPMRRNGSDPARIYRSVPYGPLLEVFLLDGRSYRSRNGDNDLKIYGPDTTLLGAAQAAWLKRALLRSTALWKVIACDVSLATFDSQKQQSYDNWANGEDGPPLGREIELANILGFIRTQKIRNTVWLAADVHYAAAHHFHPERAEFREFDPFWEFVAGPFHTRARRPHPLDATFGPERAFASTPEDLRANYPPSAGYLYFGHGRIDGGTGALTVSLRDLAGKTLYRTTLQPAMAR